MQLRELGVVFVALEHSLLAGHFVYNSYCLDNGNVCFQCVYVCLESRAKVYVLFFYINLFL